MLFRSGAVARRSTSLPFLLDSGAISCVGGRRSSLKPSPPGCTGPRFRVLGAELEGLRSEAEEVGRDEERREVDGCEGGGRTDMLAR